MEQKIQAVNKLKHFWKARTATIPDSPNMAEPFSQVPKPSKTVDRIMQGEDGKFHLMSDDEKKKQEAAQEQKAQLEELGLLNFSDDEEEQSLQTVDSQENPGGNSKFYKSALEAAGLDTQGLPETEDQVDGETQDDKGWKPAKPHKNSRGFCGLLSPKGLATAIGMREGTPSASSDDSSKGSANTNQYSPLADDDKTTDVIPVESIPEIKQTGSSLVQADRQESAGDLEGLDDNAGNNEESSPPANNPEPLGTKSSEAKDFPEAGSE